MCKQIQAVIKQFSQVLQAEPKNLQGALTKFLFCTSVSRPVPPFLLHAQKNSFPLLNYFFIVSQ